jgi:hypothetical protein
MKFSPHYEMLFLSVKQVDDISLIGFIICFNNLLEHSYVNIRINVLNISMIRQLLIKEFVGCFYNRLRGNNRILGWYKHSWI